MEASINIGASAPAAPDKDDGLVDFRVEPHDANQLELKLAYLIGPGREKERSLVEAFLFTPRTLGLVDRTTYPPARFYQHTAAFLRFKTPQVELEMLADPSGAEGWFTAVTDGLSGGGEGHLNLLRRIKLVGCIYRSAIRDAGRSIVDVLTRGSEKGAVSGAERTLVTDFVTNLKTSLERLLALGAACEEVSTGSATEQKEVRHTWRAVDEYVSLVAEEITTEVVEALHNRGIEPADSVRMSVAKMAVSAYHHRRKRGYPSYVHLGEENEELPYRRRILKRIVSSALYLDVRHADGNSWARNMIGMAAAAAAMLFAILVALWAQVEWGILSVPFVIVMVISYMIKDRIKELGKHYLGKRFVRFTPDKVFKIYDRTQERVLGKCRESVRILRDARAVEAEVATLRHNHDTRVAEDGRPETVVHYAKQITLYSPQVTAEIEGFDGLNDIIRFNLGWLRRRMDAPTEAYQAIHPRTYELMSIACSRVYHLNLVLRFTVLQGPRAGQTLERVRVVLDQKGIKRVELVQPTA